ncbi:hypothetical protein KI387_016604, partial [Taxus chinensis]
IYDSMGAQDFNPVPLVSGDFGLVLHVVHIITKYQCLTTLYFSSVCFLGLLKNGMESIISEFFLHEAICGAFPM